MFDLEEITLRLPVLGDGMAVCRLVESCPPLDANSSYCNFLQCSHFANTSVAAEYKGELVGFISGYILPARPDTLFVWQVAVSERVRGAGLASHMLTHILARSQGGEEIRYIETSITHENQASWRLFKRLAKTLAATLESSEWIDQDTHFAGQHDAEALVRIGPFNSHH